MTRAAVTNIALPRPTSVRLASEIGDEDIVIDLRFAGPGYGLPDDERSIRRYPHGRAA